MRQMTQTAYLSLPDSHKAVIDGQTWAMWVDRELQTNFTPVELITTEVKRPCACCGESQTGKKVWAKHCNKVICMSCGQRAYFDLNGRVVTNA